MNTASRDNRQIIYMKLEKLQVNTIKNKIQVFIAIFAIIPPNIVYAS